VLVVAQIQASLGTIYACRETILARVLLNHFDLYVGQVAARAGNRHLKIGQPRRHAADCSS
jgi:hypothetical protein